jgi:type IV secretory pathway VirB2 component (pilin)
MINNKQTDKIFFIFLLISFVILNFNNIENIYAASNIVGNGKSPFNNIANDQNAIVTVLCNIVNLLTGSIARGVAMIAIVVVAVGLFMGKFSWGVGLATAIGIAMIFGASTVVDWLSNGISIGQNGISNIQDLC